MILNCMKLSDVNIPCCVIDVVLDCCYYLISKCNAVGNSVTLTLRFLLEMYHLYVLVRLQVSKKIGRLYNGILENVNIIFGNMIVYLI